MKYAVVKTGGRQHLVSEGEELLVDKIEGKAEELISFTEVLLVVDEKKISIGQPLVKGVKVEAKIVNQQKGEKIRIAKFKAKTGYRRVRGHRQLLTKIKIIKIHG